jgi:hypothetical protein
MTTYVFNESTLVLEGVTLGEVVEFVVQVLVDLAGGTVLHKKTAEDSETAHPEDLAMWVLASMYHGRCIVSPALVQARGCW